MPGTWRSPQPAHAREGTPGVLVPAPSAGSTRCSSWRPTYSPRPTGSTRPYGTTAPRAAVGNVTFPRASSRSMTGSTACRDRRTSSASAAERMVPGLVDASSRPPLTAGLETSLASSATSGRRSRPPARSSRKRRAAAPSRPRVERMRSPITSGSVQPSGPTPATSPRQAAAPHRGQLVRRGGAGRPRRGLEQARCPVHRRGRDRGVPRRRARAAGRPVERPQPGQAGQHVVRGARHRGLVGTGHVAGGHDGRRRRAPGRGSRPRRGWRGRPTGPPARSGAWPGSGRGGGLPRRRRRAAPARARASASPRPSGR